MAMTRLHRSRRAVLASSGLAVLLLLAACGDDDGQDVATPAVQAPVVVRLADGAGAGELAAPAADATVESSADAAPSGMFVPYTAYRYRLGESLPAVPGEADGWQFAATGEPPAERVAQLAAALGLSGELVAQSEDMGGGWVMGPTDGSGPSLWISRDGQQSWWYSAPPTGVVAGGSSCAAPGEPTADDAVAPTAEEPPADVAVAPAPDEAAETGTAGSELGAEDCVVEAPVPPSGILTGAEAEARTAELLTAMGADPAGFELETYADEWYASVTAYLRLGGQRSPVAWYFGFGAEGHLDSVSGQLAAPVEVGPYPLISLEDAVSRLQDGFYGGVIAYGADTAVAPDTAVASDEVAVDPALVDPPVDCNAAADCVPPDAEPEIVDVTFTDVRMDVWWAFDVDGTSFLLPAYTFLDADGAAWTVPAVTDDYLVVPEPVATPEPLPAVAPVSEADAAGLVGMSEDDAATVAADAGWDFRVVERDGESFPMNDDFRDSRVNVTVADGLVTALTIG